MTNTKQKTRTRTIKETYYINQCSVCGKDIESRYPDRTDPDDIMCNDCHNARMKLKQDTAIDRLKGSMVIYVKFDSRYSTDEAELIVLKRPDGTFIKINGDYDESDNIYIDELTEVEAERLIRE